MDIHYHLYDLPDNIVFDGDLALDTETQGLKTARDRLCVVQLSDGNRDAHLVHFPRPDYTAPRLRRLLADPKRVKIMHYARFDIAAIQAYLDISLSPVFCTKIASRLTRTYTDRHGLQDLCTELLGVHLDKQQQSSDWAAETLSAAQQAYAASDVLYLHALRDSLTKRLDRENRQHIAQSCFDFLPTRAELDQKGWPETDIFSHAG